MKFGSIRLRTGRALPAPGRVGRKVFIRLSSLLPSFVHAEGLLYGGKLQ